MEEWVNRCMHGWIEGWIGSWVNVQKSGWMHGWMKGKTGGKEVPLIPESWSLFLNAFVLKFKVLFYKCLLMPSVRARAVHSILVHVFVSTLT